jgi:hypothetical protein
VLKVGRRPGIQSVKSSNGYWHGWQLIARTTDFVVGSVDHGGAGPRGNPGTKFKLLADDQNANDIAGASTTDRAILEGFGHRGERRKADQIPNNHGKPAL